MVAGSVACSWSLGAGLMSHRLEPISSLFSRGNFDLAREENANVNTGDFNEKRVVELAKHILEVSSLGEETLSLETPAAVQQQMGAATALVAEVKQIVQSCGVKIDYLETSLERYRHYLAAALTVPKDLPILEIGAAPGHVTIALHLAGYKSIGLDLNELWRETYPSKEWFARLDIRVHDIEKNPLPFPDASFSCVLFTEVLEHIAVTDPFQAIQEMKRVLAPGGLLIFSTPNICNISNIFALLMGVNVFWPTDMFYGGLDRHNREYTPGEVRRLFERSGFSELTFYGINDHNNWRTGANLFAYTVISALGDRHPLLRNTTVVLARR
jgi:SAM-dependent methyltransferase